MGPLEFFEQLRLLVREKRDGATPRNLDTGTESLILNRAAVQLLCAAMGDGDPGGSAQLPAVVLLGQPGHVGFVDGCKVYYDPSLDDDAEPVVRYHIRSSDIDA